MLPDQPVTARKTIPAYLYFQYLNDDDIPAFFVAYNQMAQKYVDWFNTINLPIYTGLHGDVLDWVGWGLYGLKRPLISLTTHGPFTGPVATYPVATLPLAAVGTESDTKTYTVNDDYYKRILTWWFFKGDGMEWSIPWFKRRIWRFMIGANGLAPPIGFTPKVSVICEEGTQPTVLRVRVNTQNQDTYNILQAGLLTGVLPVPFRFKVVVEPLPDLPPLVMDTEDGLDYALLQ